LNIGIYIYDQSEVLDFSGPFEVFSTASRVCPDEAPFTVFLIGETGEMVTARAGYQVMPRYGFHNHPDMDLMMVVGGFHDDEMKKPRVLDWIATQSGRSAYTASVCSGACLLAQAGVLTIRNATTHSMDIPELRQLCPGLTVHENTRWIDEGKIITSAGISAGIDMSLHLVERFHSPELAEKTARRMEYAWKK
jgi:transcriptional regulator GlxA family with amidase domain